MKIFNLLSSNNTDAGTTNEALSVICEDLKLIKSAFVNQLTFNSALSEELIKLRMQLANLEKHVRKNELSEHEKVYWEISRLYQDYPKSVARGMYSSKDYGFGEIFLDFPSLYLGNDSPLTITSEDLISANNVTNNNEYVIKKGVCVAAFIFEKNLIDTYGVNKYLYAHEAEIISVVKKDSWCGYKHEVTIQIDLSNTSENQRFLPLPEKNIITRVIEIMDVNAFPCIADDEGN